MVADREMIDRIFRNTLANWTIRDPSGQILSKLGSTESATIVASICYFSYFYFIAKKFAKFGKNSAINERTRP